MPTRRDILRNGALLALALPGAALLGGGCAPLIAPEARQPAAGRPWRCDYCGHLTRSDADLSDERCPRCGRKQLVPISEEEMREALAED